MAKGSWREFNDHEEDWNLSKGILAPKKHEMEIRIQRTRVGRAGKTVTEIRGLQLDDSELKSLFKRLKSKCGTGGTLKTNYLELQGDQVLAVLDHLEKEGYRPKQAGG